VPRGKLQIAYAAAVAAALVGAFVVTTADRSGPPETRPGSVTGMVDAAGRYLHIDYDPLRSPADAVRQADLIVTGSLVGVADGITVDFPDPAMAGAAGTFATFVVKVDRVLDRDDVAPALGERIYLAMNVSTETSARELAALNPTARVALVLEDISDWTPHPSATVRRPDAIPAGARLYSPYPDGLWLQGPTDARMSGVHSEADGLAAAWGSPRTVDEFAARIAAATKSR
jgi:hypothetical protein